MPIVERTADQARLAILNANRLGDLIELRVDYLGRFQWAPLFEASEKPLIVTNRRAEEGGRFKGTEKRRLAILREAIDRGAEFVDVEKASDRRLLRELWANKKKTRLILSFHDFQKTPTARELEGLMEQMRCLEPDVVKIVTFVRAWEDNFRLLALLSRAKKLKQITVAFGMGPKGKISRILAPLMGSPWTYASADQGRTSAPGQMTVEDMRTIWERMR